MKYFALILTFVLTAGAVSLGQQSQATSLGTISGTVVDSATGKPIPFASIQCEKTAIGAVADAYGNFSMVNMPPGAYVLNVKCPWYVPRKIGGVEVIAGRPAQVDICLTRICQQPLFLRLPAPESRRSVAPIGPLTAIGSDLFLCAAQIAGSSADPEEQKYDLKYVVNDCCRALRLGTAVEILESIVDESVRAEVHTAVDSFSLDDRRMLESRRFESTPEAYERWNAQFPIEPFKLNLDTTDLDRLVALTRSFSTPENRLSSLTRTGSLLLRHGHHDKGLAILHSALPALDSVGDFPCCEKLGRALLEAGDTTTGVVVLGRALIYSIDSCSYVTPEVHWNSEALQTMIDMGAYDVACKVGSEHGDFTTVQSAIAVSLARKGRCRDALERLLTCAEEGRKYVALEDISVACAERGEDSVARVALSILYEAVFGDSILGPRSYSGMLGVVYAYARSGLVERALEIASTETDTQWYCHALLLVAEELEERGAHDSALVCLKDVSAVAANIADSLKRNDIVKWLAFSYLSLNEIPMVWQTISSMSDEYDRSQIVKELALRYI